MYEAEANSRFEAIESLPAAIVERLAELGSEVESRTILPWGEHCTECVWPSCYTTCDLYSPRTDGNCRLFVDGMVRIDVRDALRPYLLKLRFKQWGKLWTVGNLALYAPSEVQQKERMNTVTGAVARSLPLPGTLKRRTLAKVAYRRRQAAETAPASGVTPDCFLLECYNPHSKPVDLTLTVRRRQRPGARAFQRAIRVPSGWLREKVPFADIRDAVDLSEPFEVEIAPNDADGTELYVGLMDFVTLRTRPQTTGEPSRGKTWKCVVWDLDNTLWDGTLIEDGPEGIRLREDVVAVIKETDRRGILHSVVSKNNQADAMEVLRRWKLDEYFLYPQISWEPKSRGVTRVAQLLSIGVDSLAFVDDQPFEREEVRSALPQVAVVDASEALGIPTRAECQVPVTEESRQRRSMYRQEEERELIRESFQEDYSTFLRECDIELNLSPLTTENAERVYELAQRTNQMNFSGARYSRSSLEDLRRSDNHDTYVIRCSDRFGSYGIVGFGVVETAEPRLLDLMFSCRIQGKRVEHTLLAHLLDKYSRPQRRDFFANFRRTEKNASHGTVFEEVGFEVVEMRDGVLSLAFPKDRPIPQEGIIRIVNAAGPEAG
jgi:FkbH-like protein